MNPEISITLNDEVLAFINEQEVSQSSFITQILLEEKQKLFLKALDEAYLAQENDPVAQAEIALWSVTVNDGLDSNASSVLVTYK